MKFMVTNVELADRERIFENAMDGDLAADMRFSLDAEIAWHLRQRRPNDALKRVSDLETAIVATKKNVGNILLTRLGLIRAEVDFQMSRIEQAREGASQALSAFEACCDNTGCADALSLLAHIEADSGARDKSSTLMSLACTRARVCGDEERARLFSATEAVLSTTASLFIAEASWNSFMDRCMQDVTEQRLSAKLSTNSELLVLAAFAHDYVGTLAIHHGDNKSCIDALSFAIGAYREVGQERRATFCACKTAAALSNQSNHAEALEFLRDTLQRARERAIPREIAACLIQCAHALCKLGNLAAAGEYIVDAEKALVGLERSGTYTVFYKVLGEIELAKGNLKASLAAFHLQEENAFLRGNTMSQILALQHQIDVLIKMGQPELAKRVGHLALVLVRLVGNPLVERQILRALLISDESQPAG